MTRLRAKYGAAEARAILSREAAESAAGDANAVPLGEGAAGAATRRARAFGASLLPSLPAAGAAEWWDAALLVDGASYGGDVLREKITLYVEHPVPLAPPAGAEAPAPAPQPLKLTKAEQKKLRTQRRVAREQEKQEMIRQGLLEPPKPKVKISNLMRVLTDTAAADPTAIEKEVRAQMAERAEAHEDRNLARALTPAERKEKKLRKMFEDSGGAGETHVRVYRIESLENPKHKFRVDVNAQENRLTGASSRFFFFFFFFPTSVETAAAWRAPARRRTRSSREALFWVSLFCLPVARRREGKPERSPRDRPLKTSRSLCTESLRALSGDRGKSRHEAGNETEAFFSPLFRDAARPSSASSEAHRVPTLRSSPRPFTRRRVRGHRGRALRGRGRGRVEGDPALRQAHDAPRGLGVDGSRRRGRRRRRIERGGGETERVRLRVGRHDRLARVRGRFPVRDVPEPRVRARALRASGARALLRRRSGRRGGGGRSRRGGGVTKRRRASSLRFKAIYSCVRTSPGGD